jgi:hypothetical protein
MAIEPKPTRLPKIKPPAQTARGDRRLCRAIENWDLGYSFSLNSDRQPIDPYDEFRHLQVKGRLLQPVGLRTDRVQISLLPRPSSRKSGGRT